MEREEDAGPGPRVDGQLQEVHTVEEDLAAHDLVLGVAHDRERERALAGAVRPHDRVDRAALDHQIDAVQDRLSFDADDEVADL